MDAAVALPVRIRLQRTAVAALVGGAVFGLLYAGALPCLFARVTHHPCPGCGSTRAVWALLHGDIHGLLTNNPFGPAMAILCGILGIQGLVSIFHHGDLRDVAEGKAGTLLKRLFFVIATLEIGLWILRFFGFFGGPVSV